MIILTRYISTYESSFMQKISICKFLFSLWSSVILSCKELHLITSNPEYIPTYDIIQGYFLIKIGWWLVVYSECCLWSTRWGLPCCAVTCCKLAKLGWNKIEHQNTFFQYFFLFLPYFWYPLNIENDIFILAFRGLHHNKISVLFHQEMVSCPCV